MESLHRAIQKWVKFNKRHTPRTQGHYKMAIRRFKKSLSIKKVYELKPQHIQSYIVEGVSGDWKNRTGNAHLTVIKSFSRWLSKEYDIPNSAANIEMLREEPPQVRVIDEQEYQKILDACENGDSHIIQFIANTGLRSTEFTDLTWQNIALDLSAVTFTGKGRKRRTVPLNQVCRDILSQFNRLRDSCRIQFLESLTYRKSLYNICERLSKRSGVPAFGPHALRHFFATRLMRKDVPIAKISKLLGHGSITVTERMYIHWMPSDLDGVTDCLDL